MGGLRSPGRRPTSNAGHAVAAALVLACLVAGDAAAQTICTITLNSDDEGAALRAAFPHARHVELTDFSAPGHAGSDWLEASCRAGVSCDVLLVSGHFANTFFGETRLDLPLRTLERQTCHRTCESVLKRPPLVFLFGCNTLATKARDRRTPDEYRRVLLDDRLDPTFAERVVALRYSPLGPEVRERMRRVFGNASLVFGFSSVGPLGAAARPRFERFLRSTRSAMDAALSEPFTASAIVKRRLTKAWQHAFSGLQPMVVAGADPPDAEECAFTHGDQPRLRRLEQAERLLARDPLRYAPIVWEGLGKETGWQPDERAVLRRVGADARARRDVLSTLPRLTASLDSYFSLVSLARLVGWLDEAEARHARATRLEAILAGGITDYERDFLCSQSLAYAPSPKTLATNAGRLRFVETLPCVARPTPEVRAHLKAALDRPRVALRVAALDALTQMTLLGPADGPELRARYLAATDEYKASLLWALAVADGDNAETERFVAAALADRDPEVAWTAARVLQRDQPRDAEAVRALTAALARPEGFVRRTVAVALSLLAPFDAATVERLRKYEEDEDAVVRRSISHALSVADRQVPITEWVGSGR